MSKAFKIFDKTAKETAEVVCDKLSIVNESKFLESQNYFQYYKDGAYGIIDYNGKFLLAPIYDGRIFLEKVVNEISYFRVEKNGLFGIIDSNGQKVLDIIYSEIYEQDDLYRIKLNGLYGFLDNNFILTIEPIYSKTGDFSSNLCYVKNDMFIGFINKKGDRILDSSSFKFCEKFYGKLASFDTLIENLGVHHGFININGEIVVEPKYYSVKGFHENLIVVSKRNGFLNLLNQDGVEIIDEIYSSDITIGFYEKLAKVKRKAKYGFIDTNGTEVIKCKFSGVENFHCGISVFKEKKIFGGINILGEILISPKYDNLGWFVNCSDLDNPSIVARSVASIGSSFGLIDANGNEVVPLIYDDIYNYPKEGLYKVKKRNDYGFVDVQGKELVTPQYRMARNFSNGLAAIKNNEKWGFVNISGKVIIECNYTNCSDFVGDGYAILES
jgi:hypothetical protein